MCQRKKMPILISDVTSYRMRIIRIIRLILAENYFNKVGDELLGLITKILYNLGNYFS